MYIRIITISNGIIYQNLKNYLNQNTKLSPNPVVLSLRSEPDSPLWQKFNTEHKRLNHQNNGCLPTWHTRLLLWRIPVFTEGKITHTAEKYGTVINTGSPTDGTQIANIKLDDNGKIIDLLVAAIMKVTKSPIY